MGLRLHVFREIPLGLEREVAVLAHVRPEVAVRPNVFLEHRGFLAPNTASVAHVAASTAASNVGVVVLIRRLVAALDVFPLSKLGIRRHGGLQGSKNFE